MIDLDALYHLPYDGVIIDILVFSPLVDDVLDLLQPCLEATILTLALSNRRDAFGELVDLCGCSITVLPSLMVYPYGIKRVFFIAVSPISTQ